MLWGDNWVLSEVDLWSGLETFVWFRKLIIFWAANSTEFWYRILCIGFWSSGLSWIIFVVSIGCLQLRIIELVGIQILYIKVNIVFCILSLNIVRIILICIYFKTRASNGYLYKDSTADWFINIELVQFPEINCIGWLVSKILLFIIDCFVILR